VLPRSSALTSPRPYPPGPVSTERAHAPDHRDHIIRLYRTYAADLDRVREKQRKLLAPPTSLKAQLDDPEAEITYLLLREDRPETVVEIGAFHGWSTTWILQALRDNGTGHLYSYRHGSRPSFPSRLDTFLPSL
jgi:predicted O-methyltransferase YrrM